MIEISIKHRVRGTTFTKLELVEDWKVGRTDKQCNATFRRLLEDMRSTVKAFNEPKDKPQEADLEKE